MLHVWVLGSWEICSPPPHQCIACPVREVAELTNGHRGMISLGANYDAWAMPIMKVGK